jgi:hypothetical protein
MQTLSVLGEGVGEGEWYCRPGAAKYKGRQKGHFNKGKKRFICTQQILNHLAKLKEILKNVFILFLNIIIYISATNCDYSLWAPKTYEGGSKSFRHDIQKPRQMENAARDIYI